MKREEKMMMREKRDEVIKEKAKRSEQEENDEPVSIQCVPLLFFLIFA